ncbi:MAG TPA: D-hexose-6-phosphate mutarotase [Phycisphaerae bacterium]
MTTISELNSRHAIPGVAEVIAQNGGLPAVRVDIPNLATGSVYLHGAHVATWRPAGFEEVLWLSEKGLWQNDKPIRGGVPICFPWFGPRKDHPQSPAHGIARLHAWELESIQQSGGGGGGVSIALALRSNDATRAQWPHDFLLRHRVTFGKELTMVLELTNTGTGPMTAEEAFHTYFSIADVHQARVKGLAGTRYIDKVDAFKQKTQEGDIAITGETDRVYLETAAAVTVEDPIKRRRITVSKENSRNTVVWNPWIAKAKAMADFGDEEWPAMVCVETCNVGDSALTLSPGQTHIMTARIAVAAL